VLVETPKGDKSSFAGDAKAIEVIREAVTHLRAVFPSVQAGVTGAPVLSNDEMSAAFQDSQVATVLSFVLTLAIMWLAYWRLGKPVLMLIVLAVSIAWSLGVITLTLGHLTIFSVMFISIVVGIGIDYGIYFLFRYEEELFLGRRLREAIEITAARTGPGMLLGALTAGGTFFVLMLTEFRGIKELGYIAGTVHHARVARHDDGVPRGAGAGGPAPRPSAARPQAARPRAGADPGSAPGKRHALSGGGAHRRRRRHRRLPVGGPVGRL
jgi:uncharacterized membrane protein YdfJ with MMPL/SSD domain